MTATTRQLPASEVLAGDVVTFELAPYRVLETGRAVSYPRNRLAEPTSLVRLHVEPIVRYPRRRTITVAASYTLTVRRPEAFTVIAELEVEA